MSLLLVPREPESAAWRYIFAAACCVTAFFVRLVLDPLLKDHSPLLLFALAVAISAIRGFGPGIFATFLGTIGALYFFPPTGSFYRIDHDYLPTAIFQIALFLAVGSILGWLGGAMRRLRWDSSESARQRNEILESITDGFLTVDDDFRLIYLNQAAARLAPGPREAVNRRPVWDELPGWCETNIEAQFRGVVESQRPAHFESCLLSTNRWLEFHLHPAKHGVTAYFRDVTDRKLTEIMLKRTLAERDDAFQHVRLLSGLLPICAACKKIRDTQGDWHSLESYISDHSEAKFSHSMCSECVKKYYGDFL